MTRIIFCEGKTDAILLSYYLGKTKGWIHNKKPTKFKITHPDADNEFIGHYKNEDGEELSICAVGGKDNFLGFYKEHVENYILESENEETEYKIAFVIDRDNREIEEIEKCFSDNLSPCITSLVDGTWMMNAFENSFGQEAQCCTLGVVIPHSKQGALENLLMDALSEDTYRGNLVDKSKSFVEEISPDAAEIMTSERLKLKTKLGVSLAVLYPEKVFSLIDEQLKSINWERSQILNDCFKELINI